MMNNLVKHYGVTFVLSTATEKGPTGSGR